MKLWPTTTENKCFVKMLWHLLDKCVKVTVLLICSICTFFLIIDLCFFSYISINYIKSGYAATMFCHYSYNVFHCSSTVQFWYATLSFFLVLNNSYNTRWHCSYSSYSFFFFFGVPFVLFFFYIYCYTDTTNFTIIDVSISYKTK